MALRSGGRKLQAPFPSGWYLIDAQNLAVPNVQGARVTASCKQALSLMSDAADRKLRPYVVNLAIRLTGTTNVPPSVAGSPNIRASRAHIGCCFDVVWNQPSVKMRWSPIAITLTETHQRGRIVNPVAQALQYWHPAFMHQFYSDDVNHDTLNWQTLAPNINAHRSTIESWEDDDSLVTIQHDAIAAVQENIDVMYVQPMCIYSGTNRFGALIDKDRLPLAMLSSQDQPWEATVSCLNTLSGPNSLFGNAVGTAAHIGKVELWAYLVFEDMDSDYRHGVSWGAMPADMVGPTYRLNPHIYRMMYYAPNFKATTLEAGYRYFYEHDSYSGVDGARIRHLDGTDQIFPLKTYGQYRYFIDMLNTHYRIDANPKFGWSINESDTRYNGGRGATPGIPLPAGTDKSKIIGTQSTFPILPILANAFCADRFQQAFFANPRSQGLDEQLTVQLEQYSVTTAQTSRMVKIFAAEYFDEDEAVVRKFEVNGNLQSKAGTPKFLPAVDKTGPLAGLVTPLVPQYAVR